MITPSKKCWICKKNKSRNSFHKDSHGYDGLTARCKICDKSYRKEARAKYLKIYNQKRHEEEKRKRRDLRLEILQLLGGICVRCGFEDIRALQVDHIHGGGVKERKLMNSIGRWELYLLKEIKKGSKKYQLLCANCNWIKRFENDEVSKKIIQNDRFGTIHKKERSNCSNS